MRKSRGEGVVEAQILWVPGLHSNPPHKESLPKSEFTDTTVEEEHDMANCLILLAQGQNTKSPEPVVAPTTTRSKATGLYLYECKTCNRCFSSFQALGGHRASHKKPKAMGEENKKPLMVFMKESDQDRAHDYESTALSLQIPNRVMPTTQNKSRVHECSVCGAEFSSGQALGGHMRRHRTMNSPAESPEVKKPRAVLSLDLNLPAPEDDHRESKFPFGSKEQVIVFSANSLAIPLQLLRLGHLFFPLKKRDSQTLLLKILKTWSALTLRRYGLLQIIVIVVNEKMETVGAETEAYAILDTMNAIRDHTIEWIEKHYQGLFQEIHFGNHFALEGQSRPKSDICRSLGAKVLIDDNPRYAMECAEVGIRVLLFDYENSYPWCKIESVNQHPLVTKVNSWDEVEHQLVSWIVS
ncbi:Zinc finger protein ZAT5 [Camellia lanceoleosa]|uniref:Zinc finger protein ZAT5 n=1 Tax=Camellia lanceoleosa TaxID=1840588 RepID=A0ACC0HUM0_9ERIC|nr:Zinc finger protein ZAT5 [Camellia lanceoleosa]